MAAAEKVLHWLVSAVIDDAKTGLKPEIRMKDLGLVFLSCVIFQKFLDNSQT